MPDYNDYERKLLTIVEEHGWHCTTVFDPDGNDPGFAYSSGFTKSLAAPEFITFGLSNDLMNAMIWEVYRQVKRGIVPTEGMRWEGLLEGFDCITRKSIRKDLYSEYAVSANWFWQNMGQTGHPEVYQIVWPGAQQGLFPWEQGCDDYVIDMQPQLWLES